MLFSDNLKVLPVALPSGCKYTGLLFWVCAGKEAID